MTEIYDLSDPAKPVKIREFGLVGQQPGATGAVPTELHGMISTGPQGNRIYFAYGTNKGGVMQIVDREKLLQRSEGADAREPALSGDRPARHAAAQRRAFGHSARQDEDRGVRQGHCRRRARHDHDRRRVAGERMPGRRNAPDGVVRRCDGGDAADGGVELQRARGERQFLLAAAAASALIRRTRARRRCSTRRSPS